MRRTLDEIQPVRLFRVDPDTATSASFRLLFVLFHQLPLFWRLDLEVVASSPLSSAGAAPREVACALPVSALMNALAATKAAARGQERAACALLDRGFQRLQEAVVVAPTGQKIRLLVDACARQDAEVRDLADEVEQWSRVLGL